LKNKNLYDIVLQTCCNTFGSLCGGADVDTRISNLQMRTLFTSGRIRRNIPETVDEGVGHCRKGCHVSPRFCHGMRASHSNVCRIQSPRLTDAFQTLTNGLILSSCKKLLAFIRMQAYLLQAAITS